MNSLLKYKGIHPGIILERELEKRSLKKRPFALSVGEYPQTLSDITKGKRNIPVGLALKIEKKLQDTPGLDYITSYSKPGQAVIFVYLKETVPEKDVRPTWLEVRNLVNDMKSTLPTEVQGLYFNDRFDDVYGSIYALTSDGFSYEEMRSNAEKIRRELLTVKNVKNKQINRN